MLPNSLQESSNPSQQIKSAEILAANEEYVEGSLGAVDGWKDAMRTAIRSGRELCRRLGLDWDTVAADAERDFPVFVPLPLLNRIAPGDLTDPVLRQVLATRMELVGGGVSDPVGDGQSQKLPGLLQKYQGRVLLVVSGACAIHCRYCFRREYPYSDVPKGREHMRAWLNYVSDHEDIEEVILSGGDPLSLADETLTWFLQGLQRIPHLRRLRIHTRFPIVIPQRMTRELVDAFAANRLAKFFVLHINHANELDARVFNVFSRLRNAGVTLLNQSVLLAGVNDSVAAQQELCTKLLDHQVIPYYLHQLDPVRGAMHFDVPDERAREIVEQLRCLLPGYGVPNLVREIAGEPHKTPLQ